MYAMNERIDEVLKLLELLYKNPCCCQCCKPRIKVLKKLNGNVEEKYGLLEYIPVNYNGLTIIVSDDPGCFTTRVLEGFGTTLSCSGIKGEEFHGVLYNRDCKPVGEVLVKYRRTRHTSYYYTEELLEEYGYIILPSDRIPRPEKTVLRGNPSSNYMLAQAIGLYASINYGYRLITLYYSTVTPGNELRETVDDKTIVLGSRKFYERVKNIVGEKTLEFIGLGDTIINTNRVLEIISLLESKRDKFKKP